MSAATTERLMDAGEVGLIIRRHRNVVLRMAKNEEIGCIRPNSRVVLFLPKHVDEWIAEHEVLPKATSSAAKSPRNPRKYPKR